MRRILYAIFDMTVELMWTVAKPSHCHEGNVNAHIRTSIPLSGSTSKQLLEFRMPWKVATGTLEGFLQF